MSHHLAAVIAVIGLAYATGLFAQRDGSTRGFVTITVVGLALDLALGYFLLGF